ncbi:protein LIAT1 [Ambystoma mexicanum]|uniref:protein LIAT1 n=1 Tax=Ambystoma mexicanum TaxID=8296 RepID=UPI0037E90E1E
MEAAVAEQKAHEAGKGKASSRHHPKASSAEKKKHRKKDKQAKAGADSKKRSHSSSTPPSDETAHNQKNWKQPPKSTAPETTSKGSCTVKGAKKTTKKEERKDLSSSSSSSSFSVNPVQELSNQINESLRWSGVLDDPLAEEERIRQYKANRRRRYYLAAKPDSSLAARIAQEAVENCHSEDHRLQLVLGEDGQQSNAKKDQSNAYFLGHPDSKAESGLKLMPLRSPSLVKMSQDVA